jgi:uncharacterized Rossmann fold enzyme
MVTFACVLYQGEDVPAHSKGIFTEEWVDRLYRGIKRNCTRDFRFVCFVDRDDYEFKEPVETKKLCMPYRNMFSLLEPFREDMGRVVFMGLDTIIVGNIDWLADYSGPFMMLRDPYFPERDCSGVMAFPYTPEVWEKFVAAHEQHAKEQTMFGFPSDMIFLDAVPHETLEATDFGPSLADASEMMGAESVRLARPRRGGIYSYKVHCRNGLPKDACIVYFHGKEKPHELFDLEWVEKHWGEPMMTKAQFENALNNDTRVMLDQVRENIKRSLPWLKAGETTAKPMVIVGGGPSLGSSLPMLTSIKARGGVVFALNNTHDWLIERGIVPDYHVMLDSREENVKFVQNPQEGVKYLISAFCHPKVFEALEGFDVTLWLNDMDGVEPPNGELLICGGSTVGLKTMCIGCVIGFREIHLFGMDSSYTSGKHHAYEQPMNDTAAKTTVVVNGETFLCDRWMAKQAAEFQPLVKLLEKEGCSVWVHGYGLIPWIASQMAAAA